MWRPPAKQYILDGVCLSEKGLQQIRNLTLATRIPKERRPRGRGKRGELFRHPGINRMSSMEHGKCDEENEECEFLFIYKTISFLDNKF